MSVLPPQDTPADLYLLLGRIDGKVDGIAGTLAAMNTRTETLERRVGDIEHEVASIASERAQMVPDFKKVLDRATDLETWQTRVQEATRTTTLIVRIVWAIVGSAVIAMLGWGMTAYVHSLEKPAIEHRETTRIESTVTSPAGVLAPSAMPSR